MHVVIMSIWSGQDNKDAGAINIMNSVTCVKTILFMIFKILKEISTIEKLYSFVAYINIVFS